MNFFGLSEDKLYYDERKKRFVSTKDAPGYVERAYKNSHFKDVSQTLTKHTFSKGQTCLDRRSMNSKLNWSSANNWSDKWTTKQNLKCVDCGDSLEASATTTSTHCLMTSAQHRLSIDLVCSVHGHGTIHHASLTSWIYISYALKSTDWTFQFKDRSVLRKKS